MNILSKVAVAGFAALVMPAAAWAACPSYAQNGAPLSFTAESAYIPQAVPVIAGGDLDLSTCAQVPGVGYIVQNPDFTMQYNDLGMGRALEIRVQASCDTVLLVNTTQGAWLYNDDANGIDPGLRIEHAPGGQYDIWVGTYGPQTCDAQLQIETF
ncbi:MAG: peptidase S1 [Pararhodobacter sp.]